MTWFTSIGESPTLLSVSFISGWLEVLNPNGCSTSWTLGWLTICDWGAVRNAVVVCRRNNFLKLKFLPLCWNRGQCSAWPASTASGIHSLHPKLNRQFDPSCLTRHTQVRLTLSFWHCAVKHVTVYIEVHLSILFWFVTAGYQGKNQPVRTRVMDGGPGCTGSRFQDLPVPVAASRRLPSFWVTVNRASLSSLANVIWSTGLLAPARSATLLSFKFKLAHDHDYDDDSMIMVL